MEIMVFIIYGEEIMKKSRRSFSVLVILSVSVTAVCLLDAVGLKKRPLQSLFSCIEITGQGIPYIPQTAAYVKIEGRLRKILKFEPYRQPVETDCKCPKCCNGTCYIIVYSDAIILCQPIKLLYFLWLDC